MNFPSVFSVADHLAPFVAHSIKISLILTLVSAVLYAMRRTSASVRSFILSLALVSVAILPLSSLLLPPWAVLSAPVSRYLIPDRTPTVADSKLAALEPGSASTASSSLPAMSQPAPEPSPWRHITSIVYFLGVGLCGFRLAAGLYRVSQLRRSGTPPAFPDHHFVPMATIAGRQIGLGHDVTIRLSDIITVPMTCGWFRPAILLPSDAATWSPDKLKTVLLHEMAHIKRKDNLTSFLVHLAIIWQWFNPLPWLVLKWYAVEREKACDNMVLCGGVPDVVYAGHLMEIGRATATVGWLAPAGLAYDRKSDFERRLMDILDTNKRRGSVTVGKRVIIGLLAVSLLMPLASLAGKAPKIEQDGVTPEQRDAMVAKLSEFYSALSDGDDFKSICDRFLTKDYFNRPELTMENLDRREWDNARKRMTAAAHKEKLSLYPRVAVLITAIRPENGKFILTEKLNLLAEGFGGGEVAVVNNYEHHIEMVQDNGTWKVSRYDDGVSLMRMDVDNPYGPIFLLWVKEQDTATTPIGPWVAKVLPATIRDANIPFLKFVVED